MYQDTINKMKAMAKSSKPKPTDAEAVEQYMAGLDHPLKREIELLRTIIRNSDERIAERVKWNAPSYHYREDLVTFNPRDNTRVHLVFHHPTIEEISSPILEGKYKGRRMAYFSNVNEIREKEEELRRVLQQLLRKVAGD